MSEGVFRVDYDDTTYSLDPRVTNGLPFANMTHYQRAHLRLDLTEVLRLLDEAERQSNELAARTER